MRQAVFALAALQILVLIGFAAMGTGGSDPAGNAMSTGYVTLAGIVMAILLAPALILAINRKAENIALGLAVLSLTLIVVGLSLI